MGLRMWHIDAICVGLRLCNLTIEQPLIDCSLHCDIGDLALYWRHFVDAVHLGDTLRQPSKETQLSDEADLCLIVAQNMRWCLKPLVATDIQVLVYENMFPRHEDIVVNNQGIRLIEARRKRVIIHA